MSHSPPLVPIVEDFAGYTPPDWVRPTIERLLASLPAAHTAGLGAIVLSDSAMATTRKVTRARRQRQGAFLGRYHHAWQGDRAWIEIVVDLNVERVPRRYRGVQLFRDFLFATVLFHEIGHHLHSKIGALRRGSESSADEWALRLALSLFSKQYPDPRAFARRAQWMIDVMRRRERFVGTRSKGS